MRRIPKRRVHLGMCGLACLAISVPIAMAEGSFDGDYTGKRWATNGSPADICPTEDNVSVTIQGDVLTFTNSAVQNFRIRGFAPGPDGKFDETDVDIGGDVVDIQGRIAGGVLEADVNNPPCEHLWRLEKK
jgi:hypothetical protein